MTLGHVVRHSGHVIREEARTFLIGTVVALWTGLTPDRWIEKVVELLREVELPDFMTSPLTVRAGGIGVGLLIIVIPLLGRLFHAKAPEEPAPAPTPLPPLSPIPAYELRVYSETPTTEALSRDVVRPGSATPSPSEIPTASTARLGPGNAAVLPRADYCIGRDELLDDLVTALRGPTPLSCLVRGSAGIGKTTLTLAAANNPEIASRFRSNRWFVKLDTATDASSLQTAVVVALGLDPAASRFGDALTQLREQPGLLILDNLETPWEAETETVEDCLNQIASIPGVALLVSIRGSVSPHSPHWDCRIDVGPLADTDGSTLFRRIAPKIQPRDQNLTLFLKALGGIPLAIELVAYRAEGDATLAELWAEWQRLGGALAARPGVDPSRLTSLPHSIDLSLQSRRLGEDGKRLFRLLGQLPAGIARDDRIALFGEAAARAGEELRSVGLAIVRGDRLDLLPPIRDHASRHYPPEGDDDARWRAHYLGLLDEIASPGAPVGRLVPEFANLEEAIREQLQRGLQVGATPTVHGLSVLMRLAGLGPVSLIERLAAARSDAGDALGAANCVHMAGEVALARSDHDAARDAYDRALPLYRQVGDILGEANCIKSLGDIALARSDHDAARDAYRRAQPLYRQVGDILGEANCIRSLGDIARERSDREAARDAYDRALSLYRQVGDILGEANCIKGLGDVALEGSDHDVARDAYERALLLHRQVGDILGEANCIKRLGDIAFDRSDREAARDAYDRALPLYRQVGDILGEANCIRSLGDIALARSNHDAARLNYLEALALYERIAEPYSVGRAHLALIPITGGTERAAHIAAARAAWMSIGRADLVEKLLPPDT